MVQKINIYSKQHKKKIELPNTKKTIKLIFFLYREGFIFRYIIKKHKILVIFKNKYSFSIKNCSSKKKRVFIKKEDYKFFNKLNIKIINYSSHKIKNISGELCKIILW